MAAMRYPSDCFSVFYLSSLHFSPLPDKVGIFLSETPILVVVTCHFGERKNLVSPCSIDFKAYFIPQIRRQMSLGTYL